MLTGAVDLFKGAPVMPFQGVRSGSNPKIIGTNVGGSDYVIAVREEISGFEAFQNSDLSFGISGKGAISHTQPVGCFSKEGISEGEVNWVSIGGSSARTQAVAAGNVDGTAIHLEQMQRLKSQDAPVKQLAMVKDYYPNFIVNCMAVLPDLMESEEEFIQEYTNAVVQASQKAHNDFDWFNQKMQKYFAQPLSEEDARSVWELLTETVEAWPHDKDSYGTGPYEEQMNLYLEAGLLDEAIGLDDFVVTEYWNNAVDNL
jgi:ABC-type nitrate/sulfonate/bicarbonate transport system substrate-binding protein